MIDKAFLASRYNGILASVGFICLITGLLLLTPMAVLVLRPQEISSAPAFLIPGMSMTILGFFAWRHFSSRGILTLTLKEGSVALVLGWAVACIASAVPFMMDAGLDFTHAVFESVSGWTTTGLSAVDLHTISHPLHLWRGMMQLAGGAGLAVILLSVMTGPMGSSVTAAEGRELLIPHVKHSARLVLTLYSGYSLLGILAFRVAGMGWFDSVIHAFTAISTGGFSTHPESIAYFDSPAVEAVAVVLMVLGNLNFVTAWALVRGDIRSVWRSGETRLMAILLPVSMVMIFLLTCRFACPGAGRAARAAVFETVTALTTTGFSTVGYSHWNGFGVALLIILMLIGGGTCSTAGGIKQFRIYALWRSMTWDLRKVLLPSRAIQRRVLLEMGREVRVSEDRLRQIGTFVFLYLALFLAGSIIIMAHGFGFRDSLFEFASALGTVGASIGLMSPDLPPGVFWTLTSGMFLGRLEIFIVFAGVAILTRDGVSLLGRRTRGGQARGNPSAD